MTDERMKPEDLDRWLEAAGLAGQRGWPNRVHEILGVDPKRWKRMRAGETIIPRYLGLAMAAHLAGLAPWPVPPGTAAPEVAKPTRAKDALGPGTFVLRRQGDGKIIGTLTAE